MTGAPVAGSNKAPSGSLAHARVRLADPQQAASPRALRAGTQTRPATRRAHKPAAPVGAAVESAKSQASQQAQSALRAAESLLQQSALANRRHGGGRGTHGKGGGRGKHHGSTEEPPVVPPVASGTGSERRTVAAAVLATTAAPATPATPTATAPRASASLVPQLASVAAQPFGATARSARPATSTTRRRQPVASTLAPVFLAATAAGTAAGESGAAAETAGSARRVSTAAKRSGGNPLERIGRQIPLPIPVPDWSKPVIVALLLLALALAVRAGSAGARARRLERQSAGLRRDVGAMQAALVPEVPTRVGGLEVSVAYKPAEGPAAGGDFYDLFVPRPGTVAMMLGDISGHGHEALTHAALARYTLRAYLQAGLEPRAALALAGRVLADPSGARYATVAVGIYDEEAGTLTYSLAGHPPPVFIGGPALGPVTACSSPPVGWGIPTGRRQTTVSLPTDSEVCFFSDGLVEARNEGRLLGRDQLRELLAGLGSQPQAEQLLEEVRRAAPATPDDMVACILSAPDGPDRAGLHVEELELDTPAMQRGAVRRFLCECNVAPTQLGPTLRKARDLVASTGGAVLRVEVGAPSSVSVAAAPSADGAVKAARGEPARDQFALASLAAAS
ncbi:MAG TPA: PP2C family protein-serine/threonine phosphatase [Solirubrobacteraceae bacterium]|nr:PP2C family protein-serine/threonine phosphatase [Solirubrobacteraceae bacterium]